MKNNKKLPEIFPVEADYFEEIHQRKLMLLKSLKDTNQPRGHLM